MLESTFITLTPRGGLDNVVGVFSISELCVYTAESFLTVQEFSKQYNELLPCFLQYLVAAS